MDIYFIREHPAVARENQKRRFADPAKIDQILKLDEKWRSFNFKIIGLNKLKNKISKSFTNATSTETVALTDDTDFDSLDLTLLTKAQLKTMGQKISNAIIYIEVECGQKLDQRDRLVLSLDNMLHTGTM